MLSEDFKRLGTNFGALFDLPSTMPSTRMKRVPLSVIPGRVVVALAEDAPCGAELTDGFVFPENNRKLQTVTVGGRT